MTERIIRVRFRAVGMDSITRATRGITQAARGAARAQSRAEQDATREATRSAAARERAAQRASQAQARAAEQASRAQIRAAQQAAREEQRAAAQSTRTFEREQRQRQSAARAAARAAASEWRTRMARAGAIGGALVGAGRAAYGRVSGYQSALGMPTRDQLVTSYVDRQRQTIRLAHQSGVSSADLNSRIDNVARSTGVDQGQLLGGLQYAQAQLASPDFNAMDVFSRHLEEIAQASYATGAPVEDLIGALGQMRNQFGITESDFSDMIGTMVEMAANGSIEIGDLASGFTSEMAQFRQLRGGVSGVQAAREFAGTAEVIGRQTPGSPEEAATAFRGVMSSLGSRGTRRGIERQLRRGGLSREDSNVFDDRTGALTVSMPELVDRMRRGHLDTAAAFDSAGIHNVRAQAGFRALLGTSSEEYSQIVNSSSEAGNQTITATNNELRNSAAGRVDQARANAEANFQEHGAAVVDTMVEMAAGLTEMQTRFPAATEAMSAFVDVLGGLGGGGLVGGVGGRLLAGGGIAGALGLGGAGASAGGAAAGGGLLAGGIAAAGAAGALLWNWVNPDHTGETVADSTTAAQAADATRAGTGGLSTAARDELIRQRQSLGDEGGAALQRQVIAALQAGQSLTPETIQALAEATGRAVATHAEPAPAPSSVSTPSARRVPAERR